MFQIMDYQRARKTSEKSERREAILDASKRLFASQGLTGTNIEQIAATCSLSRSLIYTYYLDKSHIFILVVSEALSLMRSEFSAEAARRENGLEAMAGIGRTYVSFARRNPEYYDAILQFKLDGSIAKRALDGKKDGLIARFNGDFETLMECVAGIDRLMVDQVDRGVRDGSIRPQDDPGRTARALWAMVAGLIQASPNNLAVIETGIEIAKEGLKRPGG